MPEMTPSERIECALSRQEPDRVPLYDLVSSRAFLDHWAGEEVTLENASQTIPRALGRSLDMTRVFLPEAPGRRVDAQGFSYERTDWFNEWQVGTPFRDLEGLARFVSQEVERLEAWQPLEAEKNLAELVQWKERFEPAVIPASWAGEPLQDAYIRVGLDWFVWLDAEQPGLVRRWVSAMHGALMRRLQSEKGCRVISPVAWIFADIAYKNRLMFSPRYLRERGFFNRLAEICDLYHSYQLKVIFHSDGYIQSIIPDLIAVGVDAIAPVDTAAGMDLGELKPAFGGSISFVGGMDIESVLRTGSPDMVRAAALQALKIAGPGGGLVLGASSEELFDNLPLENILAFHDSVREYGRYPIGSSFPKGIWAGR